jgi:hypothetical protein
MTFMFYTVLVLLVATLLASGLLMANPAQIAGSMRTMGQVLLALGGVVLLLAGRMALGGMLLMGAFSWFMSSRLTGLAGRFEGRVLAAMPLGELIELYGDLAADPESRQLLETYLDGRFAFWRDDAKAYAGGGERGAPGPGPMTEEEAHQILGLEAGASPADIRKAHRRLMQRVHPDVGGSSFLAARINEAKDLLLSRHG